MSKVLVGFPNNGWIHQGVMGSALEMAIDPKGHQLMVVLRPGRPLEHTRNLLVKQFLESGGDYLLMIDSDNPPTKNPLDLVALDKDVMILPTPMWRDDLAKDGMGHVPLRWNTYDTFLPERHMWREGQQKAGLHEIEAGGTGAILIARRVLEVVCSSPDLRPAFKREFDEDGIDAKGSDLLFCQKAKKAGFRIWAHYDYPCHHHKEVDLLDVNNALVWRDVGAVKPENINTPLYWDGEWSRRGERLLPVYPLIAERVGGTRVLDYGCGRGDLLSLLGDQAEGMDISPKAVELCQGRGLRATVGTWLRPDQRYDAIVLTEVLEHVDDDAGLLERLLGHTDLLIYSVPHDCLPPGLEPEHRRIYTHDHVQRVTPYLESIEEVGDYLLVTARKKS